MSKTKSHFTRGINMLTCVHYINHIKLYFKVIFGKVTYVVIATSVMLTNWCIMLVAIATLITGEYIE